LLHFLYERRLHGVPRRIIGRCWSFSLGNRQSLLEYPGGRRRETSADYCCRWFNARGLMPVPRRRRLDIDVVVATPWNLPWEMRKVYSRIVSSRRNSHRHVASYFRTNGPVRKQEERSRVDKAHPVALLTAYGKKKKQII